MYRVSNVKFNDKIREVPFDRIAINMMVSPKRIIFKHKQLWLCLQAISPQAQKDLPELLKTIIEEEGDSSFRLDELIDSYGLQGSLHKPNDPVFTHPMDYINVTSTKFSTDKYEEWGRGRQEQLASVRYYLEVDGKRTNSEIKVLAESYVERDIIPLPQDVIANYITDKRLVAYGYNEFCMACGYEDVPKTRQLFKNAVRSVESLDKLLLSHIQLLEQAFVDY